MGAESTGFASLWARYAAFLIDAVFFFTLWFLGMVIAGALDTAFNRWNAVALLAAYFGLLPATPLQGTPGKRSASIRITDIRGNQAGVFRSLVRFIASVPSIGLFGLGFTFAAFTPRRQALHDLIAGTIVVTLKGEVPGRAPRLPWRERLAVVFIVAGTLYFLYANVHVYRSMALRSKFGYIAAPLAQYRKSVEEALLQHRPMPGPAAAAVHVKSMRANRDGTIVVETSDELAGGGRLVFTPRVHDGQVRWKCARTSIEQYYVKWICPEE